MKVGDIFSVNGYDIVATALYVENGGQVVVLNNNSTHYLVAVRRNDDDDEAELEDTFHYDEPTAPRAYCDAIRLMARIASTR